MTNYVGIDMSQDYFDAALMIDGQIVAQGRFDNNEPGFKTFKNWLSKHQSAPVHSTLEATGMYGEALAEWLVEQDEAVSVVNPAQIKAYGQAQLRRAKTDKTDARLIADFARTQQPPLWTPSAPEIKHLRALVRYMDRLQEERQREQNRLHAQRLPQLQAMHREHIAYLQARLAELQTQIKAHIQAHPALAHTVALLMTIKSVGPLMAWHFVAEIDITRFASPKALVAFLGLNPHIRRSGKRQKTATPISKMGNAALRRVLYMPTINAKQHNVPVKRLYERLIERGKHKAVARIAAMRKLVHIIYGVWTSGQAFDAHFETDSIARAA
jgi:transposase